MLLDGWGLRTVSYIASLICASLSPCQILSRAPRHSIAKTKKTHFPRGKGWKLLSRGGGPEYDAKLIAHARHPGRIVLVFEVKTRTRRSLSPKVTW